jgi:hypothetical protein
MQACSNLAFKTVHTEVPKKQSFDVNSSTTTGRSPANAIAGMKQSTRPTKPKYAVP